MNLINHCEITKKIKGYLDGETSKKLELSSNEKEEEFAKLNLIFNNQFDSFGYLEGFKEVKKDNKNIYYYDVVSVDKKKKTEYIAISENDRPLLLISYSKNKNNNTNYIEEAIKLIVEYDLLEDDGIIVCESDVLDKIIYPECMKQVKQKKYGDKYIVLLEKV